MTDDRDPYDWQDADVDVEDDDRYDDDDEYEPGHFADDDDEDYVELRRESSRGRRVLTIVLVLLVILVVAIGGTVRWVQQQIDPPGAAGEPREIVIPEGSTSDEIGKLLAEEGVISSDLVWDWYLRINGGGPFQAGLYSLSENSSIPDVIDTLTAGPAPLEERSFTLPEGLMVP